EGWNRTSAPHPEACVHEMVEAQARTGPDREAVADGAGRLTYAELDERANRLAARLAERGAGMAGGGTSGLVAVCLEHSAEMVVAMLAVLKAGAAYVPLDASHPVDRLA